MLFEFHIILSNLEYNGRVYTIKPTEGRPLSIILEVQPCMIHSSVWCGYKIAVKIFSRAPLHRQKKTTKKKQKRNGLPSIKQPTQRQEKRITFNRIFLFVF